MVNLEELKDYELIEKVIDGNESAYEELYNRYATKVFNYLTYNFSLFDEAEDLVQETFAIVYKNIKLYDKSKASFYTFLLNTAERVAITYLRIKNNRKKIFYKNLMRFLKEEDDDNPYEVLETKMKGTDLAKAMDELSDAHRMAVNLFYLKNSNLSIKIWKIIN